MANANSDLSIDDCLDALVILYINKAQIAEKALSMCVSGQNKVPANLVDFIEIEQSKAED